MQPENIEMPVKSDNEPRDHVVRNGDPDSQLSLRIQIRDRIIKVIQCHNISHNIHNKCLNILFLCDEDTV